MVGIFRFYGDNLLNTTQIEMSFVKKSFSMKKIKEKNVILFLF
jgi:hypothetical protein